MFVNIFLLYFYYIYDLLILKFNFIMKKALLFFSLFTLVACSEDVYQEIDQQNTFNVGNNNSTNDGSGTNAPFTSAGTYQSPYDIWTRSSIPVSHIINNLSKTKYSGAGRLIFRFTPYLGLAYFDGGDDGLYHDNAAGILVDNLATPGLYPNLYANGHEIGNFIPALPLTMTGLGSGEEDIAIASNTTHCPVFDGLGGVTNYGRYFDPAFATPQEQVLLADYGKVFFYKYEILDPLNPAIVLRTGFVMPYCDEATSANWFDPSISVNVRGIIPTRKVSYQQSYGEVILEKL